MGRAKILVVDDDAGTVRILKSRLGREGFEVLGAASAEAGLKTMRQERPDLILLDLTLPKMDGLEMLAVLRRETSVPVIFLTGHGSEADKIVGLKLGADDYVVKPFSASELAARIQTVLRRAKPAKDGVGAFVAGGLEIDLDRHEVRVKGRYRELAPREFQILSLLLKAKGKVLSRDAIMESLWGLDEGSDVSTRTVDQHVARLRRKLLSESSRVATVKNYGYRLLTR